MKKIFTTLLILAVSTVYSQVETNEQRGENLGPRLGSNISAALKNKKW